MWGLQRATERHPRELVWRDMRTGIVVGAEGWPIDGWFLTEEDFGDGQLTMMMVMKMCRTLICPWCCPVQSCLLVGGCGLRFLTLRRTYCTLDGWRFGLRMIGTRYCLLITVLLCLLLLFLHPPNFNGLYSSWGALLWGSMIHKHTGRWMWQGSASVTS